jgi:hypothetical protein
MGREEDGREEWGEMERWEVEAEVKRKFAITKWGRVGNVGRHERNEK